MKAFTHRDRLCLQEAHTLIAQFCPYTRHSHPRASSKAQSNQRLLQAQLHSFNKPLAQVLKTPEDKDRLFLLAPFSAFTPFPQMMLLADSTILLVLERSRLSHSPLTSVRSVTWFCFPLSRKVQRRPTLSRKSKRIYLRVFGEVVAGAHVIIPLQAGGEACCGELLFGAGILWRLLSYCFSLVPPWL